MKAAFISKSVGYFVSIISVLLLGMVAWKSASASGWMMAALIGGMSLSILGMVLRCIAHYLDHRGQLQRKTELGNT